MRKHTHTFHVGRINKSQEIYVRMCWKPFECLKTLLRPSVIAHIFLLSFFAIIPSNSIAITLVFFFFSSSFTSVFVTHNIHIYMEVKCPIGKIVETLRSYINIIRFLYIFMSSILLCTSMCILTKAK